MSDNDEEKGLLNLTRNKYFNQHKALEIESFIRRSYYLCVILFFCLGVTLVSTVLAGVYKSSEITESLLITIAGPTYLVLFLVLLCCGRQPILRMALVLVVTSFVGFISGFICGANVKMVAMTLKDN